MILCSCDLKNNVHNIPTEFLFFLVLGDGCQAERNVAREMISQTHGDVGASGLVQSLHVLAEFRSMSVVVLWKSIQIHIRVCMLGTAYGLQRL